MALSLEEATERAHIIMAANCLCHPIGARLNQVERFGWFYGVVPFLAIAPLLVFFYDIHFLLD